MGWLWLFTTALCACHSLLCLSHRSLILSMSVFFCFFLEPVWTDWVIHVPAILILPSDFTRLPAKVRMAAVMPGMPLEHYRCYAHIQHVVVFLLELW